MTPFCLETLTPSALAVTSSGSLVALAVTGAMAASAAAICVWQGKRLRKLQTEFKKVRKDYTHANERAAGSRAEKTQVLRIAVQNVAMPLKELSRHVESLTRAADLPPDHRLTTEQIRTCIASVHEAIDALEKLQVLENRSRALAITSVNVGAVLAECVVQVQPTAQAKGIRLSLPDPSKTSLARADVEVLRKALSNLMVDAIEVTPPRGTVSLSVYQTTDRVLITVNDEGPGTVVSEQAALLDQSGNSRPPMASGNVRLNLAMVHNLIKAMDGFMWSQGEPGRGTTHVVELALAGPAGDTAAKKKV